MVPPVVPEGSASTSSTRVLQELEANPEEITTRATADMRRIERGWPRGLWRSLATPGLLERSAVIETVPFIPANVVVWLRCHAVLNVVLITIAGSIA